MEPNQNDTITIKNIDDESHEVILNKQSFGIISPNATRKFPRFIADHALKHMANSILIKKGLRTNNQVERLKLIKKMVVDIEYIRQAPEETQYSRLHKEVVKMNDLTELEKLAMAESQGVDLNDAEETQEQTTAPAPVEKQVDLELNGSGSDQNQLADAERSQVYQWASANMGITLDEKTKAYYDSLPLDKVKVEVQYESE